jgi:hypothetical protein
MHFVGFSFIIITACIPHVKVIEPKSSAASADEESLTVGISVTELQTKRLPRAQRRSKVRERKQKMALSIGLDSFKSLVKF